MMTLFPKVALGRLLNVGPVVSRSLPSLSLSNEIQVVTIKLRDKIKPYAMQLGHSTSPEAISVYSSLHLN